MHGYYSDCLRAGWSGDWIPVGARFSALVQTGPEAHPVSCTMGTVSFLRVRCGRGVTLTPHPLLVPRAKIEKSYTSTLPKGLCGLWKVETYLHVYQMYYWNISKDDIESLNYIQYDGKKNQCCSLRFLSWRLGPVSTMATPKRNYEPSKNIVPSWISFYFT